MKKTLIVLLILAVAGGVFAQELKISGSLNSGLQGTAESLDLDAPGTDTLEGWSFDAYAQDADVPYARADLNVDFTYDNIGAHIKLRAQGGETGVKGLPSIYAEYAYVSATVFNIVDIYGGAVDNGAWATAGDKADDVGEGLGGLVQIRPIEGLNVGFGVYDDLPGDFDRTGMDSLLNNTFTYGAAYAYPDLFKVVVSGRTSNLVMRKIFAGVEVSAIPNLSLAAEIWSETLDAEDKGFTIDEVVSYDLGDLDVGATFWQFINLLNSGPFGDVAKLYTGMTFGETSKEYDLGLKGNIWASYALAGGTFVPKLEVYVGYGGISKKLVPEDSTIFYIGGKPSITWNIAEGAKIVAAYDLGWGKVSADSVTPTIVAQKVYVDFVWSF
ncbi:MAG: hypothetical protein LBE02_04370 [Spirochaetaceae bacterium]|jgi:hypothetical protein|nr:hypothetical protein [Spirochaetaceae bacterium]